MANSFQCLASEAEHSINLCTRRHAERIVVNSAKLTDSINADTSDYSVGCRVLNIIVVPFFFQLRRVPPFLIIKRWRNSKIFKYFETGADRNRVIYTTLKQFQRLFFIEIRVQFRIDQFILHFARIRNTYAFIEAFFSCSVFPFQRCER